MVIYLGADHRGTTMKDQVLAFLNGLGYETMDVHPAATPEDDYPDIAGAVARKVAADPVQGRGIVFCGSGAGVDIVANKVKGIRSVLGFVPDQVYDARHEDDVNVIAFAADFVAPEDAEKIVRVFLNTPFGGEEHYSRRIQKIRDIESWPAIT